MKLPLAYYGDSILRKKTVRVDEINDEIRQFVSDMYETMMANDGCGLAANQVHSDRAIFVTCIPTYLEDETMVPGEFRVFINPKIISYSEEVWACSEACLSIPKLSETVVRPFKITIEATDLEGNRFTEEFEEFPAHVMMHENDHINGVLFIDRLPPKKKKEIDPYLRNIKKQFSSSKN